MACAPIIDEKLVATFFCSSDVVIKQNYIRESSLLLHGVNSGIRSQQILSDAWMTNSLCSGTTETYNPYGIRTQSGR